ncbi:E3 ubiquitin-protein ligase RNF126 isoform X2 [Ailuropoda melanoleuca]|uniref:E3 ubiquitin-protein ligase RNF126 isoform X2 n=1 Tax=Ailuropoda melanoleuca TaxID=9646 RepID=UPI001493EAF9|nr:E3 ubiquitin-protein ligase RNF126 isoform X2 [Ailuropoda melanoleuca]
MAEASPQPGRYFCHCCSVEIVPRLPDYICPRCESGFIEELPEETRSTENGSAPSTAPTDQSRPPFEGYGQFAFGIFDDSFEIPTFPPGVQADEGRDPESRREREQHSRHRYGARQPRARLTARRATGRHEGVPTLEGIIQQLVNGIITPASIPSLGLGPWGVLHSNPMDYAWGANGLDAIITQVTQPCVSEPSGARGRACLPSSRHSGLFSFSSSISLKTQAPRLRTKRKSRPSPPSPSPRNTLWAGVPRVQGRLRAGGARAAAALQSPLPRRLHCALAAAARQLPRVPEKPHGTEHSHQPPGPDRRELLVLLVVLLLQLAKQREPSRQFLSTPCRGQRLGGPPPPGWRKLRLPHGASGTGAWAHSTPGRPQLPPPVCL